MFSLLNILIISVGVAVVAKSMSCGIIDNTQGSTIGCPPDIPNVIDGYGIDVYLTPIFFDES